MHSEPCYHRRPVVWGRGARVFSDFSAIVQRGRNKKLKTTILKHLLGQEKFTIEAKNSNKIQNNF